jgi:WD40 repeat protein
MYQGDKDASIRIWNALTGQLLGVAQSDVKLPSPYYSIALNASSNLLVAGSDGINLTFWDLENLKIIHTTEEVPSDDPFDFDEDSIVSVSFSSDGNRVMAGSSKGLVYVQEAAMIDTSGVCVADWKNAGKASVLRGHTDRVFGTSISNDGAFSASGSDDCSVIVWNLDATESVTKFVGHESAVFEVLLF